MLSATTQHARAADAAILDLLSKSKGESFISTLTKLAKLADEAAAKAALKAEREQKKLAKRKAREKAAEKTKARSTRKQRT
jgi:hypothetical protein